MQWKGLYRKKRMWNLGRGGGGVRGAWVFFFQKQKKKKSFNFSLGEKRGRGWRVEFNHDMRGVGCQGLPIISIIAFASPKILPYSSGLFVSAVSLSSFFFSFPSLSLSHSLSLSQSLSHVIIFLFFKLLCFFS